MIIKVPQNKHLLYENSSFYIFQGKKRRKRERQGQEKEEKG